MLSNRSTKPDRGRELVELRVGGSCSFERGTRAKFDGVEDQVRGKPSLSKSKRVNTTSSVEKTVLSSHAICSSSSNGSESIPGSGKGRREEGEGAIDEVEQSSENRQSR